MSETHLSAAPVALYGGLFNMNAVSFVILTAMLVRHEGPDSALAKTMGRDIKGKVAGDLRDRLVLAFLQPIGSVAPYVLVAMIWFIPDRRVERVLGVK